MSGGMSSSPSPEIAIGATAKKIMMEPWNVKSCV